MVINYRLEKVSAFNIDGDQVLVDRVYQPQAADSLASTIAGYIYQPSDTVIVDGQVIKLTLNNYFLHPKNKKIYSIYSCLCNLVPPNQK